MKTTSQKIRVALTGGGSGGHVYPLIAIMEELRKAQVNSELEFHYFGNRDEWGEEVLKQGAIFHKISGAKWRRYFSLSNLLDMFKMIWSFGQAFWKMFWLMPAVLFSKGGPGSWPVVVAAWFYRVPVLIHESDAAPGLQNLLSAPFARKIAVGFKEAAAYFNPRRVFLAGNPVRSEILNQRRDRRAAKETLGFNPDRYLIFVAGGSQGAQAINEAILVILKDILPLTQIYHQAGSQNFAATQSLARAALMDIPIEVEAQSRYKSIAYLDPEKSALALSAADLVIGRAGASSIFEIAAFGKPAILIPLAGHQEQNAAAFAAAGAAKVIKNENLNSPILIAAIRDILTKPSAMQAMGEAAAKFFMPGAASKIAAEIIALAG